MNIIIINIFTTIMYYIVYVVISEIRVEYNCNERNMKYISVG